MAALDVVIAVVYVAVLGVLAGMYLAVAWSPFLLLGWLRPLFRVGPTADWRRNYLLAADLLGMVHMITYAIGTVLLGDAVASPEMIFYSGLGVSLFGMAVAGVVLPALGRDWKEGGYMTEFALLGGAVWYVAITTVPPLVLHTLYFAR